MASSRETQTRDSTSKEHTSGSGRALDWVPGPPTQTLILCMTVSKSLTLSESQCPNMPTGLCQDGGRKEAR